MEYVSVTPTRSPDSEAFLRCIDPIGIDPAELKPDPVDGPDVVAIARKAQLATAPRVAVNLDFFKVPDMGSDVDSDDGELDPMLKIVAIDPPSPASAFLKRTGFGEQSSNTLAKRLGITSTTIRRDEDGVTWLRGFDAAGEMVDCREMLPYRE